LRNPTSISSLRRNGWKIPTKPGVYWWFFSPGHTKRLGVPPESLKQCRAFESKVCLYHGMAKNLRERIRWHADQDLTVGALRSGWLSTLRFTLLALNDTHFASGPTLINGFMDALWVCWREARDLEEAHSMEDAQFRAHYFPLNLKGNARRVLVDYRRFVRQRRRDYKRRHLGV
jgi:hypothetical protein